MIARPPRPVRARRRLQGSAGPPRPSFNGPVAPRPPKAAAPRPQAPAPVAYQAPAANINYAPPASSGGATLRANAQQGIASAQGSWRDATYRAAMQLGDPTAIAKLKSDPQFAGYDFNAIDPNSAFSTLARNEETGLRGIDNTQNENNTFFSSIRLDDRGQLSNDISRQRLGATTGYEDSLKEYARALTDATGRYGIDMGEADRLDREAALAQVPQPGAGGGAAPGSPSNPAQQAAGAYRQQQGAAASAAEAAARARTRARRRR